MTRHVHVHVHVRARVKSPQSNGVIEWFFYTAKYEHVFHGPDQNDGDARTASPAAPKDGLSKRGVIHCLKRHIARQAYPAFAFAEVLAEAGAPTSYPRQAIARTILSKIHRLTYPQPATRSLR